MGRRGGQKVPLEELYPDGKLPGRQPISSLENVVEMYAAETAEYKQAVADLEERREDLTEAELQEEEADLELQRKKLEAGKRGAQKHRAAVVERAEASSKAIASALQFYKRGLADPVMDDETLCKRIEKFFEICKDEAQLPTFEKLCLTLGYTKAEVAGWEDGSKPGFSTRTGVIIRQAKLALAAIDADMVMSGQMPSAVYQFRSKNFNGMKDQSETVLTPNVDVNQKSLEQLLADSKGLPSADPGQFVFEIVNGDQVPVRSGKKPKK